MGKAMDIIVEKKCGRCGILKPISGFGHRVSKHTGAISYRGVCKSCLVADYSHKKKLLRADAAQKRKAERAAAKAASARVRPEAQDLVPAYYPDPLHAVAREWGGPVNPAPLFGLLSLPTPEAEWRMAA